MLLLKQILQEIKELTNLCINNNDAHATVTGCLNQ